MGQNWTVPRLCTKVEVAFLWGCVLYQLLMQKTILIFVKCKKITNIYSALGIKSSNTCSSEKIPQTFLSGTYKCTEGIISSWLSGESWDNCEKEYTYLRWDNMQERKQKTLLPVMKNTKGQVWVCWTCCKILFPGTCYWYNNRRIP